MEDVRYSVYRKPDDRPWFIHGTIAQCAKAMGITVEGFRAMACRQRKGQKSGGQSKWEIVREEDERD